MLLLATQALPASIALLAHLYLYATTQPTYQSLDELRLS